MAASVSTKLETITTANVVSDVMNRIVEQLDDTQREKVSQWMKFIEDHAERIVHDLTPTQVKRKKTDVIAAAAVYDAFLEFESRTCVKLGFPQIQEALGRNQCIFNTTWKKLFDDRGSLRGDQLDVVYIGKDWSLEEAITNVMQSLTKAVEGLTPKRKKWLVEIKNDAIELSQLIPKDIVKRYDTLTAAVTTIYAAIQRYQGKMQIRIAQRDLSLLSATSPALISKCWIELFENSRE